MKKLIFVAFIAIAFASCKKETPTQQNNKETILLRIDGMENGNPEPLFSSTVYNVN